MLFRSQCPFVREPYERIEAVLIPSERHPETEIMKIDTPEQRVIFYAGSDAYVVVDVAAVDEFDPVGFIHNVDGLEEFASFHVRKTENGCICGAGRFDEGQKMIVGVFHLQHYAGSGEILVSEVEAV